IIEKFFGVKFHLSQIFLYQDTLISYLQAPSVLKSNKYSYEVKNMKLVKVIRIKGKIAWQN
ncbi:hypothetical protein ABWK46_24180, partial [Peribacillus frigoritolerans]|uniref:hypothetical protein n=1 Tax=Peribacillus frigoritolerans TaxID=450367 RepID=UPI0033964B2A